MSVEQWAEVRRSEISGTGLFATREIPAGVPVLAMSGILLPYADVDWSRHWSMQVDHDLWLCNDETTKEVDHFLNHSCEPNLGFATGGPREAPVLYAMRAIESGKELTWDYAMAMGEPEWCVPCRCGAPSCRGVIQGFPALSTAVQDRLRPWCLDYLRQPKPERVLIDHGRAEMGLRRAAPRPSS